MKKQKCRKRVAVWLLFFLLFSSVLHPVAGGKVRAEEVSRKATTLQPDFDTVIAKVHAYVKAEDSNPGYGSVWKVIGLTRSEMGVSSSYYDTFYKNVYTYLEEKQWVLTKTTYSNYSKLILAMTAAGIDARDIGGHNLLAYLSDFSNVKRQGFMGPLWALMAVRCHPDYTIPTDSNATEQTTEQGLVEYLLSHQLTSGGWTLQGEEADTDVTAMTIQALSSYYGEREDVTEAIDQAVDLLASMQTESGGYGTKDGDTISETAESACQVITALSSIGIDAAEDSRFINDNGNWPMCGLFQFYQSKGGFAHVAGGDINSMATEQGLYAMAAYKRMKEEKTALYNMKDISLSAGEVIKVDSGTSSTEDSNNGSSGSTKPSGSSASLTISVSQIILDYASVTLEKGKTKALTVAVNPSSATNKKVTWSSSNKKVATVSQKGVVKGVKAGSAVIKAKAKDGSGVSASCIVRVVSPASTGNTSATTKTTTKTATKTLSSSVNTEGGNSTDTTEGGWSFSGEDYVPADTGDGNTWADSFDTISDTSTVDGTEEENGSSWADKTITIRIPLGGIFYMGVGGFLVLGIEGILWFIRIKRKGRILKK